MKTLNYLLLLSFILISFRTAAFNEYPSKSVLHGQVKSHDEAVSFVTVFVKGTHIGTATDVSGKYLIPLDPGHYQIKVQGVGYKSVEKEIDLNGSQELELNFELEKDVIMMDQVTVSGSRIGILRSLPGSASIIRSADIQRSLSVSSNEVLKQVSGVHTVEEEGLGLRANIGIRGLDPDRSRSVLMLEDGIPIALGPYGEPEMYFTPSMDRMMGVEVLKGSGQVLYGPQTIGGVINYLTADPPAESEGSLSFKGGEGSYFQALARYGNTFGGTGFTVTYLRRQADNIGPTQFRLDDLSGKFRLKTGIRSTLNLKWSVYNEHSNSTYVGLTQPMFDSDSLDELRIAPDDKLKVRRYALSATHDYLISDDIMLKTTVFGYTTSRNWLRQDFTYNAEASGLTGISYGDESLPQGAIYLRNSTGNRNRQFEVAGLEPRIRIRYALGGLSNQLDAGLRFLYERAYEQRINGTVAEALSGVLHNDEIRTAKAASAYAQNKTTLTEKFTLTGGLRFETLDYERKILRISAKDTTIIGHTAVNQLIPGAGFNYEVLNGFNLFGGIHRGFAPPRIKDAVSSSGEDIQLDAEKSWNFELGFRHTDYRHTEVELTLFYMDFSNQVIPVSESSGGAGAGLINGGQTVHRGVEASFDFVPENWLPHGHELRLRASATYVDSYFSNDRFVIEKSGTGSLSDTVWANVKGNRTPYSPNLLLSGLIGYESASGLGGNIVINYTGNQYTDLLNTGDVMDYIALDQADAQYAYTQATAHGRIGEIPAHLVVNAAVWHNFGNSGFELSIAAKNLLNERYIVTRRPQGIRVGTPRMLIAGLTYNF